MDWQSMYEAPEGYDLMFKSINGELVLGYLEKHIVYAVYRGMTGRFPKDNFTGWVHAGSWQPISSAPKDKSEIVVLTGDGFRYKAKCVKHYGRFLTFEIATLSRLCYYDSDHFVAWRREE